ncbi:MAG: TA system VapC family ribonuclease toxin [Verrucomicrobiota bacterium]
MMIPDVNLLVYAHNDQAPEYAKAKAWWEAALNGRVPVGLPWISMSGYIRLMTHPRVLAQPLDIHLAIGHVRSWLAQPPVRILHPGTHFESLFLGFLAQLGNGGNLTTDAQLAALAVEHQAELHSCDADFSRFPGLRWINPLKRAS